MAASWARAAGAADSALATGSLLAAAVDAELVLVSVVVVLLVVVPGLLQAPTASAAPAIKRTRILVDLMNPSIVERNGRLTQFSKSRT